MSPETVKALRARAGWTQDEAADVARVKLRQWQRWESGESRMNSASWALVCQAVGVAEDWTPTPPEPAPE